MPVEVPCGQCIGCRVSKSREWAVRAVHEASMHDLNSFVTLTYNDAHLPRVSDGQGGFVATLNPRDFVLFMKRLRKARGERIRFLQVGEYGSLGRPHHHALLFNCDFADKVIWQAGQRPLFRSSELEELWPYGFSSIGAVDFESAAYVARYTVKKLTGPMRPKHHVPEYLTMSRRPGLGATWLEANALDVYPEGVVTLRGGNKVKPPRYYDAFWRHHSPEQFRQIQNARRLRAESLVDETTTQKRTARAAILTTRNARKGTVT